MKKHHQNEAAALFFTLHQAAQMAKIVHNVQFNTKFHQIKKQINPSKTNA